MNRSGPSAVRMDDANVLRPSPCRRGGSTRSMRAAQAAPSPTLHIFQATNEVQSEGSPSGSLSPTFFQPAIEIVRGCRVGISIDRQHLGFARSTPCAQSRLHCRPPISQQGNKGRQISGRLDRRLRVVACALPSFFFRAREVRVAPARSTPPQHIQTATPRLSPRPDQYIRLPPFN